VATFAEILALQLENGVPLAKAIVLAAESVGEPRMVRSANEIAAQVQRGETAAKQTVEGTGFPPVLDWLLRSGQQQGAVLLALRDASRIYRRRANRQADAAEVFLPLLLTVAIGGSVALVYGLLLFLPWFSFLKAMS
jgi:type II secretory pathway component PulF